MIEAYWTIPLVAVIIALWFQLRRVYHERDKAAIALSLVEMEYRLMTQNAAMFNMVEEKHEEITTLVKSALDIE